MGRVQCSRLRAGVPIGLVISVGLLAACEPATLGGGGDDLDTIDYETFAFIKDTSLPADWYATTPGLNKREFIKVYRPEGNLFEAAYWDDRYTSSPLRKRYDNPFVLLREGYGYATCGNITLNNTTVHHVTCMTSRP